MAVRVVLTCCANGTKLSQKHADMNAIIGQIEHPEQAGLPPGSSLQCKRSSLCVQRGNDRGMETVSDGLHVAAEVCRYDTGMRSVSIIPYLKECVSQ